MLLERVEFVIVPYVNPDGYAVRNYFLLSLYIMNNEYSIAGLAIACGGRIDNLILDQLAEVWI